MRKITLLTLPILFVLLLCSQSGNRNNSIEIHISDISILEVVKGLHY